MIQINSPAEFNDAIKVQDKLVVASFSAPWCGGCKTVAPTVAKLAEELKDTPFLKISAEELEDFCDEIEVDGFPSFRIYKNGEVVDDYTGSKPEKVEEFIRKARMQRSPALVMVQEEVIECTTPPSHGVCLRATRVTKRNATHPRTVVFLRNESCERMKFWRSGAHHPSCKVNAIPQQTEITTQSTLDSTSPRYQHQSCAVMRASAPRRPLFYFIGDSLTQDGGNPTTSGWSTLLQHKYIRSVDTINRGLSGYNTKWFIKHALPVLEKELEEHFAPSFVTLWLGANDAALLSGSEAYQHVSLEDYRANLVQILRALKARLSASHTKILLITPPAVIDAARRAFSADGQDLDRTNDAAGEYARVCVEVAQTEQIDVLDLHTVFNANYPREADRSALFSDGLHFTTEGNEVVAEQIALKLAQIYSDDEFARFDAWQLPDFRSFIE